MTDLVERLRKASVYEEYKAILSNLGDEAADEIERLRGLEAILRELLEGLREGEGLRERYERRYALLDRGRRAFGKARP